MTWSWKLARIAGIDVHVHVTFLMLIGWIAMSHWSEGHDLAAVIQGVGYILALFGCVVAHEFGHALTARHYGIRTRDITLLPIGGLARLERMPDKPREELWVALAGPAVNVVIASAIYAWLQATGQWQPLQATTVATGAFLERVLLANVTLVVFNLLPAFPMDGGRALRAILATRMDYTSATERAAAIGQGLAVLFGFVGLFLNPMLLFIALFVWIGAGQEASMVQMKSALAGIPVRRAMVTDVLTLTPLSSLGNAADLLLTSSQVDFPVVEGRHAVGMLTRADLIAALTQHGRDAAVARAMRHDVPRADPSEMLEGALARLQGLDGRSVVVEDDGALVGLVTMDNVGEFLMIHAAEASHRRGGAHRPGPSAPRRAG